MPSNRLNHYDENNKSMSSMDYAIIGAFVPVGFFMFMIGFMLLSIVHAFI